MIELLLKLIDRLIDLKKYQAERLHKTFQDILDPLFNDLLSVHGNYIRIFEEVQEQLATIPDLTSDDGKKRLLEIAESLRQRRLEFEPVREKLAAMTRELGGGLYGKGPKMKSPEAQEFVAVVLQYFPRANLTTHTSRSSALVEALRGGAAITPTQVDSYGRGLPELVESTIQDCRERWSAVCGSYAKLKIAISGP
jgi:hypothetical protein